MPDSRPTDEFWREVMTLVPKWVRTAFAVAIGAAVTFGLFMSQTGLNVYFNRYMEAYVKRMEQSVDRLESATTDMTALIQRLESTEKSIKDQANSLTTIDRRVTTNENQLDDHARRIRDLEVKSRGGK